MDIVTYILAKNYTKAAIKDLQEGQYEIVDTLPDVGEEGIIYLVKLSEANYDEYIWKNNQYIKIKDGLIGSLIKVGYYYAGVFWKEAAHINRIPDYIQYIYMDEPNKELYCYDTSIHTYKKFLQKADPTIPGIMKLYNDSGDNTDGTMTQNSITTKLKKKVEIDTSELASDECLGLEVNKA